MGAPTGMTIAINMALMTMRTDPVLTLAQWFSPGFPVGAFAYSHGLEQAIAEDNVTDAAGLSAWVEDVLQFGAGRSDALFLAAAFAADEGALAGIDAQARAFVSSKERLMETDLLGAAFGRISASLSGTDVSTYTYPVAVGWAAQRAELPLELTTSMYLHAFVSSLVSVGQRLIPIGQTDGQQIIQTLAPLCQQIAQTGGTLDDLSSTAFASDIAAMRHETLNSRVFRT